MFCVGDVLLEGRGYKGLRVMIWAAELQFTR